MEKLDPASAVALHEQLSGRLRALIDVTEGEGPLPSEDALARSFDVSRSTVRRAVETLVAEGALLRRQGRGTFIARPRAIKHMDRLGAFVESFGEDDPVETRLLAFEWISAAGGEVPEALGAAGDALMFERLYLTDGEPHALVRVFLPEEVGRQVSRAQVEENPVYSVLRETLHLELLEAQVMVHCEPAAPHLARAMGVGRDDPLLVVRRLTLGGDRRPIEMTIHFLRPDVYQLELTAHGGSLPRLIRLPS